MKATIAGCCALCVLFGSLAAWAQSATPSVPAPLQTDRPPIEVSADQDAFATLLSRFIDLRWELFRAHALRTYQKWHADLISASDASSKGPGFAERSRQYEARFNTRFESARLRVEDIRRRYQALATVPNDARAKGSPADQKRLKPLSWSTTELLRLEDRIDAEFRILERTLEGDLADPAGGQGPAEKAAK